MGLFESITVMTHASHSSHFFECPPQIERVVPCTKIRRFW